MSCGNYRFGQVVVDAEVVGYRADGGNISSAVGPFAVYEGLVKVEGDDARARIHNVNTGKIIISTFRMSDAYAAVDGSFSLQRVAVAGSPLRPAFQRPGGAATGTRLTSDRASDRLELPGVCLLVLSRAQAANHVVFVRAREYRIA